LRNVAVVAAAAPGTIDECAEDAAGVAALPKRKAISRVYGEVPFRRQGAASRATTVPGRAQDANSLQDSGGFPAGDRVNVGGGQRLAADSPVAALHFLDDDPRDGAHCFAFDRHHRVSEFLGNLLLLSGRKNAVDEFDVDEWHGEILWLYGTDESAAKDAAR
jgi:hypothetical protein